MKIGKIKITQELIDSRVWPAMWSEIKKHFTETNRRFNGLGPYWEIAGTSEHFVDAPEGACPFYSPIFKDTTDVQFEKFEPVH
jgi:hypothetical protein